MAEQQFVEYVSLTAGSTFVMPNGKVCRFSGPAGGHGVYITDVPEEIAELDKLDKAATAQVSRKTTEKAVDPTLQAAVQEVTKDAERAASPAVAAAAANLAKMQAQQAGTSKA